jgi:23S rRNA pseudouridine1911/1915/1917 synthase
MPIGRHQTDRKKMAVNKDGKEAITLFKVLERFSEGYTLLEIELKTGRTHQIRVHMSHIGHPIVGDDVYSNGKNIFGVTSQLLHSHKLGFVHPTKNKWMEFVAPIPKEFEDVLNKLRNC